MALDFSSVLKSASGGIKNALSGAKSSGTAFDLLNPANARRAISGLLPGGAGSLGKAVPNIGFLNGTGQGSATSAGEDDWRVRVSLADQAQIFYKDPTATSTSDSIMTPLIETNGVIWPYTPQIAVTHQAQYSTTQLTHSNYPAHFYNASEVADIQISGEFTVQSAEEGQYLMAAVYFFRACTKMFFGTGSNAGNPPPIVFLDGYGSHYFPHVPCVVTNFTHTLPPDADYVQIPISSTTLEEVPVAPDNQNIGSVQLSAEEQQYVPSLLQSSKAAPTTKMQYNTITSSSRVPTVSTVAVTLRPIYSRKNLHERFNLDDFAQGKLIQDKTGGFGGFL